MGSLTALNPWFLVGLAAALVPLIIHLIERRRVQRVVFGSVLFLRGLVKRLARRRRTSELILLLLRMAVLAALALAFVRPFFRASDASGEPGSAAGQKATAVLIDCSASMTIDTRFDDAKTRALEVIDGLRKGDVVAVYAFGARLDVVTPWTADLALARKNTKDLSAADRGTDLAEALRLVDDAVAERGEPNRDIVVIADMQASGWETYTADWRIEESIGLSLIKVGDDETPPNVGIEKLGVPAQAVIGSEPEVLTAQIRNYTDRRQEVAVHLKLAGEEVDKRSISLLPSSSSVVSFRHEFLAPGEIEGRFVLTVSDAFAPDDRAGFVVAVKPKIRVVLVNGSTEASPKRNDGYFLKRALAPSRESIFQVTEVTPSGWDATALAEVGVVVLADVTDMSAVGVRKLERYLHRGGGAIFFVGTRTRPDDFNRLFADLAPCRLARELSVLRGGDRRTLVMGEVDLAHPVFRPFAQPHHGDFSRVEFSRYFTVTHSQAAKVLARFDNKKPAVLLKRIGDGASMLVTSGADLEMNNFALRAVFLPFVHQSAKFLSAYGVTRETQARVGDEVVASLPADTPSAQLTSPSGEVSTVTPVVAEGSPEALVRFRAEAQGIYKLTAGGRDRLFAVNLDPREGELDTIDSGDVSLALKSSLGTTPGTNGAVVVAGRVTSDEDIENSQRIGWMLLLAAALLMAAEMTLAYRITTQE